MIQWLLNNTIGRILDWIDPPEDTLREFEERFPARCPICAYHRFGLQEGFVSGDVSPHDCPEALTVKEQTDEPS